MLWFVVQMIPGRSRVQLDRPFVVSKPICSTEEREKGSSDHGNGMGQARGG